MGEVTHHWPHHELGTRILAALDEDRWCTEREIRERNDRLPVQVLSNILAVREIQTGYVVSRMREGTKEREYRRTPAGTKRILKPAPEASTLD